MKISDEGFFYTCMYSIVFKKEKMTVELNHFFFLKMTKNATKAWNALISRSQSCQSLLNELKRPCKLFLFLGFPLFFQLIMFA